MIKKALSKKQYFAVTLDKVTVAHKPFTVICTYYFDEGALSCLLNKIEPMTTEDYDGSGTASMVARVLCESYGTNLEGNNIKNSSYKCFSFSS